MINQLRMTIIKGVLFDHSKCDMKMPVMKADPFDATKFVQDLTAAKISRGFKYFRKVSQKSFNIPGVIPTGIGNIDGEYIISDYQNEIFKNDEFILNNQAYRIGEVKELQVNSQIFGYRAEIKRIS